MVCSNISIWPKKTKKQKQKFYQDMKGEKKNCLRTKGNVKGWSMCMLLCI